MTSLEIKEAIPKVELFAIPGIPLIKKGDDVGEILFTVCCDRNFSIENGDIIVVAHKVVSKAEGRTVLLDSVTPTREAIALAAKTGRDSRHCQVILDESRRILYTNGSAIITEQLLGFINTSSGVDRSNSGSKDGDIAVILPKDPDESARRIREKITLKTGKKVAVIINDSFGRPWRKGSVGMAIGIAGIMPVLKIENEDISGRIIHPEVAFADEVAASASMLMGQTNELLPVVIVRGLRYQTNESSHIQDILRPYGEDQIWE